MVRERGLDDRFAPGGKSYGGHQFLNWWPPHATGMGHLNGFESLATLKRKTPPDWAVFFFLVRVVIQNFSKTIVVQFVFKVIG